MFSHPYDASVQRVRHVQFSLMSPDEVRARSVCEVKNKESGKVHANCTADPCGSCALDAALSIAGAPFRGREPAVEAYHFFMFVHSDLGTTCLVT